MPRRLAAALACALIAAVSVPAPAADFPRLTGPYLGQKPPGRTPEMFAPGIVSTERWEASGTFSPDGTRYFFTRRPTHGGAANRIWWTRVEDGAWTEPEKAPFAVEAMEFEPHVTPDGRRIYYNSKRPHPETGSTEDSIWYVEVSADGFSEPRFLDDAINDGWAMFVTATAAGDIVLTGMYGREHGLFMARLGEDGFQAPELLPAEANAVPGSAHPYIAPDASLLLFDAQPAGMARTSLYACFARPDGGWTAPRRLGPEVNATETENCPSLSPDGKYLFFYREGNIWWVDAGVLDDLRAD